MADKVWTQEQREGAARILYIKKFGEDDCPPAELSMWAIDVRSDLATAVSLQCELTEAVELLKMFDDTTNEYAAQAGWHEKREQFLKRNGGTK